MVERYKGLLNGDLWCKKHQKQRFRRIQRGRRKIRVVGYPKGFKKRAVINCVKHCCKIELDEDKRASIGFDTKQTSSDLCQE
jgi:hypothetical protein